MLHFKNGRIKAAGPEKLSVPGLRAPLELRRHPSARRLTLRVSRSRRAVILTMPKRCSLDEAGKFLHRHLDWVHECIDDIPDRISFAHQAQVPLRGVPHELFFTGAARAQDVVSILPGDDITTEEAMPRLAVSGLFEHAPRRFQDWMVEQARKDLLGRVSVHANRLSLRPKRITIRDQRTRWGSCSSSGCLSFSWRLIMAPPIVLDYLAAHEVAHLAEMNHGRRFWQLVERTMPQLEEAKDWLRREGMDLHRYGI